ncbi:MAG TPA: CheR family methyltransferase [Candidatus Angelobacter sp.]
MEQSLKDLVRELAEERGVDFRGYKPTTLERRIRRRMQQLGIDSYTEYGDYIRQRPAETTELLNTVLINVTRFFRDPQAWEVLREDVLPLLFRGRPQGSSFRVWCAGCATGEEPYSVAILLAEFLGSRLKDYEIKIYGTDHDDTALSTARRAEYTPEAVRGVSPEIKAKYFTGDRVLRVMRDVRRMVIFGRSNLLSDAPISHVDLLICRNVLIYFDATAQAHIMSRLKYALNEGGILFLGKSESQLKADSDFIPVNAKWRLFQRRSAAANGEWLNVGKNNMTADQRDNSQEKLRTLQLYSDAILSTLESGVLVIDPEDTVVSQNEKLQKLFELTGKMVGQKLPNTELWQRCPELKQYLDESRSVSPPKTVRFDCYPSANTVVTVTVKPILPDAGSSSLGTLIYMENVTPRVTLQSTVEELETTAEELQSTNEELETTNEELQSTNEELETTNEELQSTNEELETTNEELQSLNEELETTNEELSSRTRELDEVNARYSEMMERMPWPVFLVQDDGVIYMFNSAAQKLFGFAKPSEKGMRLQELPLDSRTRNSMIRRHHSVVRTHRQSSLRNWHLTTNRFDGQANVHFTPLSAGSPGHGVIMVFQVDRHEKLPARIGKNKRAAPQPAKQNSKKQLARKKKKK